MIKEVGDIVFKGIEIEYEFPINFQLPLDCRDGFIPFRVQMNYKENPSSRGHRGWRTLEAIQTSQYWIDDEKGFCDYYLLWYLKDTFKIDFPNNKLSQEKIDKIFEEVLVKIKKIAHDKKIEIPGMTIESGYQND